MNIAAVTTALAALTIAGQVLLALGIIAYLLNRGNPRHPFWQWIVQHSLTLAFAVAIGSTLASLFFSEIAGFEPCKLCWLQRIFLFPQAVILGIAAVQRDNHIVRYALPLAFIGAAIALYHNYLDWGGTSLLLCNTEATSACLQRYVFEFGYITIPLMSLTSFALLIALLLIGRSTRTVAPRSDQV